MKITKNFKSQEFDCHDGTLYPEEWTHKRLFPLCIALEKIRALTGQSLKINSGYRTEEYNKSIYKKMGKRPTDSMHSKGIAADIVLSGMTAKQLHAAILKLISQKEIPNGGVGLYNTFVHYDIRSIFDMPPARWRG